MRAKRNPKQVDVGAQVAEHLDARKPVAGNLDRMRIDGLDASHRDQAKHRHRHDEKADDRDDLEPDGKLGHGKPAQARKKNMLAPRSF
jgi:hypothetical protein